MWMAVKDIIISNPDDIVDEIEDDGLNDKKYNVITATLIALEFTFINSLLEELFWRVYLYTELSLTFSNNEEV